MSIRNVTEILAFEVPWLQLPEQFQRQFRTSEKQAYQHGATRFKELATVCEEPALITLLSRLDNDQPMFVSIETNWQEPQLIWFSFSFFKLEHQPQFRVASDCKLPDFLPQRLQRLYRSFGGIKLGNDTEGGLLPPENILPLHAYKQFSKIKKSLKLQNAVVFFSYGNGDYVCCDETGNVFLLDHECSTIETVDLDTFLDQLLESLCEEVDMRDLFGLD